MNDIKAILKASLDAVQDQSPAILTTMGAIGVITTGVLAARGAVQADRALAEQEGLNGIDRRHYMSQREKLEITWKYYVPAVVTGGVSIACIVGSHSISAKRQAAIMGLYSLTDRAFNEYREKVTERFGEGKERMVVDDVGAAQIRKHPVSDHEVIRTQWSEHLVYDTPSQRYFTGDIEQIRRIVELFNENLRSVVTEIPLNKFYEYLGLPPTLIGDRVGFSADRLMRVAYTSTLDEYQRPVLVLAYHPVSIGPSIASRKELSS